MLNTRIDFSSPVGRVTPGPYLPVSFINPQTGISQQLSALVDTGADCCVLPSEFAALLGYRFEKGELMDITGATGTGTAYNHPVIIEFDQYTSGECYASFCKGLRTPLLGVAGFLEKFNLNINYPHRYFELTFPPESTEYISTTDMNSWPTP